MTSVSSLPHIYCFSSGPRIAAPTSGGHRVLLSSSSFRQQRCDQCAVAISILHRPCLSLSGSGGLQTSTAMVLGHVRCLCLSVKHSCIPPTEGTQQWAQNIYEPAPWVWTSWPPEPLETKFYHAAAYGILDPSVIKSEKT